MDNQLARGWTTSWPSGRKKVDNQLTHQHAYIYIYISLSLYLCLSLSLSISVSLSLSVTVALSHLASRFSPSTHKASRPLRWTKIFKHWCIWISMAQLTLPWFSTVLLAGAPRGWGISSQALWHSSGQRPLDVWQDALWILGSCSQLLDSRAISLGSLREDCKPTKVARQRHRSWKGSVLWVHPEFCLMGRNTLVGRIASQWLRRRDVSNKQMRPSSVFKAEQTTWLVSWWTVIEITWLDPRSCQDSPVYPVLSGPKVPHPISFSSGIMTALRHGSCLLLCSWETGAILWAHHHRLSSSCIHPWLWMLEHSDTWSLSQLSVFERNELNAFSCLALLVG